MEKNNCLRCNFRHKDNGNCTAVGGFCTAVPAAHCPLLRQYLDTELTPEEIDMDHEAAETLRQLCRGCDLDRFGSKYYERARAVEKVCQAVIDKKVKTPDDVEVVVRCKTCKHEFGGSCIICGFQKRKPEDFCSYGERKDGGNADR